MPLYIYECVSGCQGEWEAAHTISERGMEKCKCGAKTRRIIRNKNNPIVLGYFDKNLNKYITGRKQKNAYMKKHNFAEVG